MTDLRHAEDTARELAEAALGHDAGPLAMVPSASHAVYLGQDVVVKIIDATDHSRLSREISLAPELPRGLTAALLDSGRYRAGTREIRYACHARVPGTPPGIGMPGLDQKTARGLAEQAVRHLQQLHAWVPTGEAAQILREPPGDGGFVSQSALLAELANIAELDRNRIVPRRLLDGLAVIAERAPEQSRAAVPVHADCHWGNWLVSGQVVTALLDFEWARLGEPVDDWFFLARFSGPHLDTVLDVIAAATTTSVQALRAQCEVREASYLASDLRIALEHPDDPARIAARTLPDLETLIGGQLWWPQQPAG